MEQKNLLEGLRILCKYIKEDDTFAYCDADQMCFSPDIEELDKEDLKKLDDLGFFWDDEQDCWACFI